MLQTRGRARPFAWFAALLVLSAHAASRGTRGGALAVVLSLAHGRPPTRRMLIPRGVGCMGGPCPVCSALTCRVPQAAWTRSECDTDRVAGSDAEFGLGSPILALLDSV